MIPSSFPLKYDSYHRLMQWFNGNTSTIGLLYMLKLEVCQIQANSGGGEGAIPGWVKRNPQCPNNTPAYWVSLQHPCLPGVPSSIHFKSQIGTEADATSLLNSHWHRECKSSRNRNYSLLLLVTHATGPVPHWHRCPTIFVCGYKPRQWASGTGQ